MSRSVVACLLFTASALPLDAVTLVPLSFSELVTLSALVAYGRVAEVRGQWSDDRRQIDSVVALDVIDAFKGSPGPRVSFVSAGGHVGRYVNVIPGAPSFSEGDYVVVFLTSRGARLPISTGFSQGIYRVRRDAMSGAVLVVPPLVDEGPVSAPIVRGDPQRRPLSLAAFEAAVRGAAEAAR